MIYRPRPAQSCPVSLDFNDPDSAASKERRDVCAWIERGRVMVSQEERRVKKAAAKKAAAAAKKGAAKKLAAGERGEEAVAEEYGRPEFKAYAGPDVAAALEKLFHGKCAYCESPYPAFHPVDVEHWRPKSEVDVADGKGGFTTRHGYEWLAMDWNNLLPSCIDCNRGRYQMMPNDKGVWERQMLGKANQFPVDQEAGRLVSHAGPQGEVPLLLDPCVDDPARFFDFAGDGVIRVHPKLKDELLVKRAEASIRVYALNRKGLVDERLRFLRWMEMELRLIRFLHEMSGDAEFKPAHRAAAEALVTQSFDRIQDRIGCDSPYSGFIGQRWRIFLEKELGVASP